MTHAIHSSHDEFDPAVSVLADNCPRCKEHAYRPFDSLDDGSLARLVAQIENGDAAVTTNDMRARGQVRDTLAKARRLARIMGSVAFEKEVGTFI